MKEIIFWFSSNEIKKYWFDYALNYFKKHTIHIKYNKMDYWIQFLELKISFKTNSRGDLDLIGIGDKNQYWVENLFDNNFEEFFMELIFDERELNEKRRN